MKTRTRAASHGHKKKRKKRKSLGARKADKCGILYFFASEKKAYHADSQCRVEKISPQGSSWLQEKPHRHKKSDKTIAQKNDAPAFLIIEKYVGRNNKRHGMAEPDR